MSDTYLIEPTISLQDMGMTPSKVVALGPTVSIIITSQDLN